MRPAGESWRRGLREWCRTGRVRLLAEALSALSGEEREAVWREVHCPALRRQIEEGGARPG